MLFLSLQESRELAEQKQKEKDDLLREHKKAEREMIKKGKKPFFMKKCKCSNIKLMFLCVKDCREFGQLSVNLTM